MHVGEAFILVVISPSVLVIQCLLLSLILRRCELAEVALKQVVFMVMFGLALVVWAWLFEHFIEQSGALGRASRVLVLCSHNEVGLEDFISARLVLLL